MPQSTPPGTLEVKVTFFKCTLPVLISFASYKTMSFGQVTKLALVLLLICSCGRCTSGTVCVVGEGRSVVFLVPLGVAAAGSDIVTAAASKWSWVTAFEMIQRSSSLGASSAMLQLTASPVTAMLSRRTLPVLRAVMLQRVVPAAERPGEA